MFNCREVMLVNIFRLTPTKSEVTSQMVWKVKRRIDCSDLPQIMSRLHHDDHYDEVGGWPPLVVAFQHYYDKEAILNRFKIVQIQ